MLSRRITRVRKPKQLPDFEYAVDTISTAAKSTKKQKDLHSSALASTKELVDVVVSIADFGEANKVAFARLSESDCIKLDELSTLSGSTLFDLFAEEVPNLPARQYAFTCCLVPDICTEKIKSYGNANKAKMNMEKHLVKHVTHLKKAARGGNSMWKEFTTISIQARKRMLSSTDDGQDSDIKRLKADVKLEPQDSEVDQSDDEDSQFEKNFNLQMWDAEDSDDEEWVAAKKSSSNISVASKIKPSKSEPKKKSRRKKKSDVEQDAYTKENLESHMNLFVESHDLIQENQRMLDRLKAESKMKKLPYRDHCYLSLPYSNAALRKNVVSMPAEALEDLVKPVVYFEYTLGNKDLWFKKTEDDDKPEIVYHDLAAPNPVFGMLKLNSEVRPVEHGAHVVTVIKVPKIAKQAPTVSEEMVLEQGRSNAYCRTYTPGLNNPSGVEHESNKLDSSPATSRPYPPMPKYMPEMGTKLVVPEEEMNYELVDIETDCLDLNNPEHVKQFAVRCMRELRSGRSNRSSDCATCKICKKEFTAMATLMYHYRSHADIKPFICLLCNASFTRQHSLNYHMLIHNNANRFRCEECHKEFRHPSHFKEHKRRHTGETPFKCSVCGHLFKTRNSYKRHMTTKHKDMPLDIKPRSGTKASYAESHGLNKAESAAEASVKAATLQAAEIDIKSDPDMLPSVDDEIEATGDLYMDTISCADVNRTAVTTVCGPKMTTSYKPISPVVISNPTSQNNPSVLLHKMPDVLKRAKTIILTPQLSWAGKIGTSQSAAKDTRSTHPVSLPTTARMSQAIEAQITVVAASVGQTIKPVPGQTIKATVGQALTTVSGSNVHTLWKDTLGKMHVQPVRPTQVGQTKVVSGQSIQAVSGRPNLPIHGQIRPASGSIIRTLSGQNIGSQAGQTIRPVYITRSDQTITSATSPIKLQQAITTTATLVRPSKPAVISSSRSKQGYVLYSGNSTNKAQQDGQVRRPGVGRYTVGTTASLPRAPPLSASVTTIARFPTSRPQSFDSLTRGPVCQPTTIIVPPPTFKPSQPKHYTVLSSCTLPTRSQGEYVYLQPAESFEEVSLSQSGASRSENNNKTPPRTPYLKTITISSPTPRRCTSGTYVRSGSTVSVASASTNNMIVPALKTLVKENPQYPTYINCEDVEDTGVVSSHMDSTHEEEIFPVADELRYPYIIDLKNIGGN